MQNLFRLRRSLACSSSLQHFAGIAAFTVSRFYVGLTLDPERRLKEHNWGESRHTNRFRPWQSVVTFWFAEDKTARMFERYLKSGSGREFVKRHFAPG
jgi:predicted GIY-YIG superfamily endonuclease